MGMHVVKNPPTRQVEHARTHTRAHATRACAHTRAHGGTDNGTDIPLSPTELHAPSTARAGLEQHAGHTGDVALPIPTVLCSG